MKIVGIVMVKNEDVYIERAIRNVAEFCDVIYIDDNGSTDNTFSILERLAREFEHIQLRTIEDTVQSNDNLVKYFGTNTWVFAVDGDEIYDPVGLSELKTRLTKGEFANDWLLLGNCLHVTGINGNQATGYMTPDSKSMTKLYNFSLISDFPITDERLHGLPVFKDGGDAISRRVNLYEQYSWDDAFFRCVHTAFVTRTSKPRQQTRFFGMRLNPPQVYKIRKLWRQKSFFYALPRVLKAILEIIVGNDERTRRYKMGPRKTMDVSEFFPG